MSRPERLFQLLQALRTLPTPVTSQALAHETGVSIRSVYRDIGTLRAGGADIAGEPGSGYTLMDDGRLGPRTFSRIEIEALTLGLAQVRKMGDPALATAAEAVLAKVAATLPSAGQQHMLHAVSHVHQFGELDSQRAVVNVDMDLIRQGCWREEALEIDYADRDGSISRRTIWPLAIVYLGRMLVVLAHCCLRDDFRIFRLDRVASAVATGTSFRPRRVALLRTCLTRLGEQSRDVNDAPS
jgi:predicted DNA-binding transcriptional regulator YafY